MSVDLVLNDPPGVEKFWSRVATDVVADRWDINDGPVPQDRPADTWITFTTLPPSSVADGEHDRPVH